MRRSAPTPMTKTHTLSASQVEAFPNVLRSQETIEPMISGRAAAALPAKLARARPRACRCFCTHSLTPSLSGGLGVGDGTGALHPPVSASMSVEIAMPIAVRIDAMVMPCLRKCSNSLGQSLVFMEEPPDGFTNSVELGPESCFVRGEGFEPRLYFKFEVGELALKLFYSISNILLNFGVIRFRQFLALPGKVLLDFGCPVLGILQLRQVVSELISHSSHGPLNSGELSRGLCDPRDVNSRIINGLQCGFDVFYALTWYQPRRRDPSARLPQCFWEGFLCTLECLHDLSAEPPRCPRSIIREPQRSPQCIGATSPVSSGQRV